MRYDKKANKQTTTSLSNLNLTSLPLMVLKMDVPILTCIFFIFNWLTLTSEMHFVTFFPEVASCLLSRDKRKYAPLVMRLLWKYINYFLVHQLTSHILLYLQNCKEFEAEILDLKLEKYGLSFDIKKKILHVLPVEPWGWECDRYKVLKLAWPWKKVT